MPPEVHILHRPTSRPSTKSTDNTTANAPKTNVLPLPAGKYGKSTTRSTRQHHQANEGKCGLEAGSVWALGTLRSFLSKKRLSVGNQWETHFWSNHETEKCIEDHVDRETAVARKWVEDAETAIEQEQEDKGNAQKTGLTTTKPK